MKTLTVRLPESVVAEIERESQRRRVSKSDVVRERLDQSQERARKNPTPFQEIAHILEQSWDAKVPTGPPRFNSPKKQKLVEIIRAKKLHRR